MGRQIYFLFFFLLIFISKLFIIPTRIKILIQYSIENKYTLITSTTIHSSNPQTKKKLQHNLIEYSCFPFLFPELCEIKTRLFFFYKL